MPKMVYDCLDEDPLVPVSWYLQLVDSTGVHLYGLAKDVLKEVHGSSTLVDFLVVDMDPRQQTSIILGAPFLRYVKADINERKGIINIRVKGKHEKFTFHPKTWHTYTKFEFITKGDRRRLSMLRYCHMSQNTQNRVAVRKPRDRGVLGHLERSLMQPVFKAKIYMPCQECHVECATISSHIDKIIFNVWRQSCPPTLNVKLSLEE
jgi:hypothetical protein